ncbi:MAG: hypothetical protein K6C68_08480 [Ruminococcus sp.]|nr:hypothetical protein [Ruminococcus sp.]
MGRCVNGRDLPMSMRGKGTAAAFAAMDADGRQKLTDSMSKSLHENETEEIPYSTGDRLYPEGYYL